MISATSADSIVRAASSSSRTDERNSAPCIARIERERNSRCPAGGAFRVGLEGERGARGRDDHYPE